MIVDDEAHLRLAREDIEGYLREHERKELLRLVVIGSVDDGKSTLIGRLLHDTQGLYDDQLEAVRRASARGATRGEGSTAELDLSLVTDGLRAEREQGITIDVAYRYFATSRRKFIIADTPGHVQYTRNMATGASTANVALILVDARLGGLGQTRRHAYIAALLGIPHLIVCVNKMDLVGWEQAVFEQISADLSALARQLGIPDARALPVSALRGDQVVNRGEAAPWYRGPPLLELLETVPIAGDRNLTDLRFPVQTVLRPSVSYRGFAGQVASGVVRVGDQLVALPSGKQSRVTSIDTYDGPLEEAFAPQSVTLRLADEIDVSRGDMLVRAGELPAVSERIETILVWLSERPMDPDKSYLCKHTTRLVRVEVEQVLGVVAPEDLLERQAERLALNEIGRVTLRAHQPLFCDPYGKNRATGAFILIDSLTNDTVAAGMIQSVGRGAARRRQGQAQVSAAERRERLGQLGAVVRAGGADQAAAEARAYLIERVLFDAGRIAAVVPDAAAPAVAVAGVIAIVATPGPVLVDEAPLPLLEGVAAGAVDDEAIARAVLRFVIHTAA